MIYQSRYAAALNGRFKTESISHDPFEGVFTAPVLINITGADNYAYSISENHKFFRLNPLHKSSSSKRISFVPSNCFTHSHRFARVFLSLKFDRWVNEPDPPPPSSLPPLSSLPRPKRLNLKRFSFLSLSFCLRFFSYAFNLALMALIIHCVSNDVVVIVELA